MRKTPLAVSAALSAGKRNTLRHRPGDYVRRGKWGEWRAVRAEPVAQGRRRVTFGSIVRVSDGSNFAGPVTSGGRSLCHQLQTKQFVAANRRSGPILLQKSWRALISLGALITSRKVFLAAPLSGTQFLKSYVARPGFYPTTAHWMLSRTLIEFCNKIGQELSLLQLFLCEPCVFSCNICAWNYRLIRSPHRRDCQAKRSCPFHIHQWWLASGVDYRMPQFRPLAARAL